jgi:hypothetical protein
MSVFDQFPDLFLLSPAPFEVDPLLWVNLTSEAEFSLLRSLQVYRGEYSITTVYV